MPIRKSRVSGIVASGTTADRPTNPSIGDTFFNGTLGVQEIYTDSGWLPATGANDFNIVLSGSETSVTLDKEYFAGAYTINSALSDSTYDLYLFDTQDNSVGYTNTPSVNATGNFNKIVVLGGTAGDLLSFSYKTTFTTSSFTSAQAEVGPVIKSISVADLPNIDDTTVITGVNFAANVEVTFTGTDNVSLSPKSLVRSSDTSLLVTRPDNLIQDYAPYTITVTNPGAIVPTGSNGHTVSNGITAGGDPSWVTASDFGLGTLLSPAFSQTLQATDPDGGAVTYSLASGSSLPPGLTLNSSTGALSGNVPSGTSNFIISATDSGGNVTNRSFSITALIRSSLTWSTYGSGVVVTETDTSEYSVFNISGTNVGWEKGATTAETFQGPFTIEAKKNVTSTAGDGYAMFGITPQSLVASARASNVSYDFGYMQYPVTPTSYNYYERNTSGAKTNGNTGPFTSGDTVYITVDGSGVVKYWKNGTLVRTTSATVGTDFAIQVANYAQNSSSGGFYDIKVYDQILWDGTSYS